MKNPKDRIVFPLSVGLNTRFNPDEVGTAGMRVQQNADGFEEFLALGKIPGASYASDKGPGTWHWLAYYEHFALDGSLKRRALGMCLDRLFEIETDGSLSFLDGGYAQEPMREVVADSRIHFSSANNPPKKFDGSSVTKWGVDAPGLRETLVLPINDEADWTINSTNTKANVSNSKTDGNAVEVTKASLATTELSILRGGFTEDLSVTGQDTVFVWLFIPAGQLDLLRDSDYAVRVRLGDAAVANYREFRFSRGQLVEGWNLVPVITSDPDATVGAPPVLASTAGVEFGIVFAEAGLPGGGFVWSKLFYQEVGTPTPVMGAAGVLDDTFRYRVTYVTKYGVESNAGPVSVAITPENETVELFDIPRSPDPQVTRRRVYRDFNGDGIFRLLTEIEDNVTSAFTDNVDTTGQSATTPPKLGDQLLDNRPPPALRDAVLFNGYVWAINAENPFVLERSNLNSPETYPQTNAREFDSDLQRLERHQRGLMLHASDRTFILSGDTPSTFRWDEIDPEIGATGPRAGARVKGIATVWHDDGPYLNEGFERWYIGSPIKNLIEALDSTAFASAFVMHDRARFRMLYFVNGQILVYVYGGKNTGIVSPEGSGVDPQDTRVGGWNTMKLPASVVPSSAAVIERLAERPEAWVGCTDGRVYRITDPDEVDYRDAAFGTAPVEFVVETNRVSLRPEGQERYGAPRYVKIAGSSPTGATLTCTVSTYSSAGDDATADASISFPIVLGIGDTSPIVSIPTDSMRGSHVGVRLEHSIEGESFRLRGLEVIYEVGRFRGRRAA